MRGRSYEEIDTYSVNRYFGRAGRNVAAYYSCKII